MKTRYWQALVGTALLALALPWAAYSETNAHTAALTAVWCLMAMGWNIISGFAGPLSLGQGAFFGLTAFSSTVLFDRLNLSPIFGIMIGVAASVVLAAAVGLITLRLSGLYFALATLTVPLILGVLTKYFGYYEISRPYVGESLRYLQFDSSLNYYLIAAILVAIGLALTAYLAGTRTGRYFVAIRENTRAAEASGVPTARYKLYAFLIGAAFSAIAGGLYSQLAFVFNPDDVYTPLVSVQALLIVLIGGPGTVLGPLIGALIVIPGGELMTQHFSQLPGLNNLAYAAVLLVVALFSHGGLYPLLEGGIGRLFGRRAAHIGPAVPNARTPASTADSRDSDATGSTDPRSDTGRDAAGRAESVTQGETR
ncbi:branched-chain amino acid ABC transporter permease [Nocardioides sp. KR10-350]|uniref:branched-chain amino acid ABC transporter permease n=1 Tax=Nocardioides cheoyonin TaxID=3156615 RepID=UPI0032B56E9E